MCDITKAKALLNCKNAVAGMKNIFIVNYEDYNIGTSSTDAGHVLLDLGTISNAFKYALKNTANTFDQTIASSRDNGTTLNTQTLNFTLTKLSKQMEFQIKVLAWGRPLIFVELNDGNVFLMGIEHGCEITGNSTVGGSLDGLQGYTMTAVGTERDPIFYLEAAEITALRLLAEGNPNVED